MIEEGPGFVGQDSSPVNGIRNRWRWCTSLFPFDGRVLETHPIQRDAPDLAEQIRQLPNAIVAANETGGGVLIHSDLSGEHIFTSGGHLSGIIDFGSSFIGVPAWEFATLGYYHGWETLRIILRGYTIDERTRQDFERQAVVLGIALGLYKYDKALQEGRKPNKLQKRLRFIRETLLLLDAPNSRPKHPAVTEAATISKDRRGSKNTLEGASSMTAVREKARPKIIVMGRMCHDAVAGAVWHFLNYLLGFEKLGFEAYYVEWTDNWVANPVDPSQDQDFPRVMIGKILQRFGFGQRWICRADHVARGATYGGLAPEALPQLYREAEALVNVSGTHVLNEDQQQCKCRIYLETDPGIPQIKIAGGDAALEAQLDAHTHFFTFAENLRSEDCLLPPNRFAFHPTRQAVALDQWISARPPRNGRLTTISKWEKKKKNIEYQGELYRWSKSEQFLRFLDLPSRAKIPLEVALSGAGQDDINLLFANQWSVVNALEISASLDRYREYVCGSAGEFTIAKDQYVRLRTGWFSDRSACYLAAGRPVITQDTGFGCSLPTGEGLFSFNTMEDIVAATEAILQNPEGQSNAAREIAHEYFDAGRNLARLLEVAGQGAPERVRRIG